MQGSVRVGLVISLLGCDRPGVGRGYKPLDGIALNVTGQNQDVGRMERGEVRHVAFRLENAGLDDLELRSSIQGCDCTFAPELVCDGAVTSSFFAPKKAILRPGCEAVLNVEFAVPQWLKDDELQRVWDIVVVRESVEEVRVLRLVAGWNAGGTPALESDVWEVEKGNGGWTGRLMLAGKNPFEVRRCAVSDAEVRYLSIAVPSSWDGRRWAIYVWGPGGWWKGESSSVEVSGSTDGGEREWRLRVPTRLVRDVGRLDSPALQVVGEAEVRRLGQYLAR